MKLFSHIPLALAAATVSIAMPAFAGHDREHASEEVTHVAQRLHEMGVVKWDEIEWDDGCWKVDDAIRADGSRYDLKLKGGTLEVIGVKREGGRKHRD